MVEQKSAERDTITYVISRSRLVFEILDDVLEMRVLLVHLHSRAAIASADINNKSALFEVIPVDSYARVSEIRGSIVE